MKKTLIVLFGVLFFWLGVIVCGFLRARFRDKMHGYTSGRHRWQPMQQGRRIQAASCRAFGADYGLPDEFPAADAVEKAANKQ